MAEFLKQLNTLVGKPLKLWKMCIYGSNFSCHCEL